MKAKLWTFFQNRVSVRAWDTRRVNWHTARSPRVCPSLSTEAGLVSGFPAAPAPQGGHQEQRVPGEGQAKAGKRVTCVLAPAVAVEGPEPTCSLLRLE